MLLSRRTRIHWPESGEEGAEDDDERFEYEIVRNYAMILPFRLNLNEGVLTVADFAFFCFG